MPTANNFTLEDVTGIALAFLLFACLTLLPGYTLAWSLNILRFRQRELGFRFLISVPLSIAIFPLLSDLIGRAFSLRTASILFAVLSSVAFPLHFSSRRRFRKGPLLWVIPLWCIWATFALIDLQFGNRLYFSVISFDYAVRTAFISSITTFGLPARNPFFYPGGPVLLRYHYYWLIPSAMVNQVVSDARQCLMAGTLWCGIGFLSLIALYLRFFKIGRGVLAFALLLVTGLDILPALFFLILFKRGLVSNLPPSVEWWNDQIDGFFYSMLWEPHYMAGLIAALFGFLLISQAGHRKLIPALLAGLAFAGSIGAAIYVAFVFAIFLVCWSALVLYRRWYSEFQNLLIAGAIAFICSLPFLGTLRTPGSGGAFLHPTVRSFFFIDILTQAFHWVRWQTLLANFVALPLNYFLELGLFFLVGIYEFRRLSRKPVLDRADQAFALLLIVSVAVCTFLRSGVIANNDLGWRGFLLAQFILLLRVAQLLSRTKKVLILATLGLAGTFYDQGLLRFYPLLSDANALPKIAWLAKDNQLGLRTYSNREAYEWLRTHSRPQALIQQNPNPEIQDTFYGLYANRNTLAEDRACATTFGGNPRACPPLQDKLSPLFSGADTLESACRSLPALDFVITKDTDPVWSREDSWLTHQQPVFANSFVRVFRCR